MKLTVRFYCLLLTIFLLSGCSTVPFTEEGIDLSGIMDIFFGKEDETLVKDDQSTEAIAATKETKFPEPGERAQIFDPKTQQNITVIFGETFASASGKLCSSVTMTTESKGDTKSGLVCLNENNEWDKNPMNIQLIQSP